MYCYVVKSPVFRLQRGSAKWPIAPSNFSPLCLNQSRVDFTYLVEKVTDISLGPNKKIWDLVPFTYGQWTVLATLQVKSWYGCCNKIWILCPFSKVAEKTRSCFALNAEHQYWTVTVLYLYRAKKISMTSNVLPLHFATSKASSSQNSNVNNF